jgi:hypothetical protein
MNQEESPEIYFGAIFEDRKDKIAALNNGRHL